MKFLFVHQNFPGQYRHLIAHLRVDPANEIVFLTERVDRSMVRVRKIVYKVTREVADSTHSYLRQIERSVLRGQAVARTKDKQDQAIQVGRTGAESQKAASSATDDSSIVSDVKQQDVKAR